MSYSEWTPWDHYIFLELRICRSYKLSIEQLTEMMNKQKGCCPICGDSLAYPHSTRSYHIDHDHDTLKVRGLLCHSCNLLVGYCKEDKRILESAVLFLEEHNG